MIQIIRREGRLEKLAQEIASPIFRQGDSSALELDRIEAMLKGIRVKRLGDLQEVKNAALYVGLSPKGNLVSPGSTVSVLAPLRELGLLTLAGLKAAIALLTK